VRVIGKIPAPLGNDTTYAAGVSSECADQAGAAAFIAALTQPAERGVWTAAGFEWPG
jgi:ABC-type molybdate transport system substrate-binding protein